MHGLVPCCSNCSANSCRGPPTCKGTDLGKGEGMEESLLLGSGSLEEGPFVGVVVLLAGRGKGGLILVPLLVMFVVRDLE